MLSIEPGDRRALLVGAALIVATLAVGRWIPALRRWEATRLERAALAEMMLASTERSIARAHRLADHVARDTSLDTQLLDRLFLGRSPHQSAAALARLVELESRLAGVRLTSNSVTADTAFGSAPTRVSVRLVGSTDVIGLARLLGRLEGGAKAIRTRDISVTQPHPAAGDGVPESLQLEMVVEGLAWSEPPLEGGS